MYYFVGIKGAGMSALAQIMKQMGLNVSGSDKATHFFTQIGLEEKNIHFDAYNRENIKEGMIIIQGNSIKDDHEEIVRARELNLTIIPYIEMLGNLTSKFKTITIAGCHGKTTTTSMLSLVFNEIVGCNYFIGDGTGFANQKNEYFAVEACEYKRHFLYFEKEIAIITNIDLDHVDYFKDIDDVIDAYQSYVNNAKKLVIACGEDPYTKRLVSDKIKFYGFNDEFDIVATNVVYHKLGTKFTCIIDNKEVGTFDIPVFGEHLVLNSLAVIAAAYYEGLDMNTVGSVFKSYEGAKRRFHSENVNNHIIIDDYAHHPNEVKTVIAATKQKYPNHQIIGIFQPHTFSRTEEFYQDFIESFKPLHKIYVLDIHQARELQSDYPNITSNIIIDALENAYHIEMEHPGFAYEKEDSVYLIMSPNDLSVLKNNLIEYIKKEEQ